MSLQDYWAWAYSLSKIGEAKKSQGLVEELKQIDSSGTAFYFMYLIAKHERRYGEASWRKDLIAFETGEAVQYGLFYSQQHGRLFITPGEKVYGGMIVGTNPRVDDIVVNVCKTKHLTNTRSSSSDDALRLEPVQKPSLEQYLDMLDEDELLEITPVTIRMRKKTLDHTIRGREDFRRKKQQ